MPSSSVRPREAADIPGAAAALVSVYTTDGYPVEGVADPSAWLSPPGLQQAWVGVLDDVVVGHAAIMSPNPRKGAVQAWIDQGGDLDRVLVLARLFVRREGRGYGLGSMLTERASGWAEEQGKKVVLDVIEKDVNAVRIYERLGWRIIGKGSYETDDGREWMEKFYVSP